MSKDSEEDKPKMKKDKKSRQNGSGGFVYVLAFIGALVYYIQQAEGFWQVIVAILKSFVWPAFLVYELLKSVGA